MRVESIFSCTFETSGKQSNMEPDLSYERKRGKNARKKRTLVVEVGLTQKLYGSAASMLGKPSKWIKQDIMGVLVIKLYGYDDEKESTGMLVVLVDKHRSVCQVLYHEGGECCEQGIKALEKFHTKHFEGSPFLLPVSFPIACTK